MHVHVTWSLLVGNVEAKKQTSGDGRTSLVNSIIRHYKFRASTRKYKHEDKKLKACPFLMIFECR